MREILFRGKRRDNGEWETGSFVGIRIWCSDARTYIADKMTGYNTPVIPETVGQYTGLTDKNGKKIFEGDIIKLTINRSLIFSVNWVDDCGMFCLKCLSRHPRLNLEAFDTDFTTVDGDECEIIGNVFDNSDLLKGGENQ